jgi:hypothetical protein
MPREQPFPTERLDDSGFAELVATLCARPGMYVRPATFDTVVAYLDGFTRAQHGGPLLGFREWLVVRHNGGNNLHWAALADQLLSPVPKMGSTENQQGAQIQALGKLITEYLGYRSANGITKVYYEYGKWLLRQRWYRGPLRKDREKLA